MDVPTAPTVIIESPAPCSDAIRAKELLKKTLGPALAPRASWSVIAHFSRVGNTLVVEGEITDEVDAPVAHRVLTEASPECSSLARAVGVWASLVLDSEVERAERPPAPPTSVASPPPARAPLPAQDTSQEGSVILAGPETTPSVELGVTLSLMAGEGAGVMAGPTLYGVVEAGKGWFLRPSILLARTLEQISSTSDVYGTLAATRFDACGRISGFHIKRIMLDVCGGTELGFLHFDQPSLSKGDCADSNCNVTTSNSTLPFLALGPSLALRGELGAGLAFVLRGVGDLNVIRDVFVERGAVDLRVTPSYFVGRGELGLSWELR